MSKLWVVSFGLALPLAGCGSGSIQDSGEGFIFSSNSPGRSATSWETHLKPFRGKENVRYLELGVLEGRSLFWMLDNILTHPTARAVAVDAFPEEIYRKFKRNFDLHEAKDKVTVVKSYFDQTLPTMERNSFDIIYLDGGHMGWTTLETALLAWPLLKAQGVLIFDDYLWFRGELPDHMTPKPAVDAFVYTHRYFLEVLERGYMVTVKKVPTSCDIAGEYACSPLNQFAYQWTKNLLFDTATSRKLDLSSSQSVTLEGLLRKYESVIGAVQFQAQTAADAEIQQLIREVAESD